MGTVGACCNKDTVSKDEIVSEDKMIGIRHRTEVQVKANVQEKQKSEPKINSGLDIVNEILKQYKILKPKYKLQDDVEKQKILASIAKLDQDLADAFS